MQRTSHALWRGHGDEVEGFREVWSAGTSGGLITSATKFKRAMTPKDTVLETTKDVQANVFGKTLEPCE